MKTGKKNGLFVVRPPPKSASPLMRSGESIPETGLYDVFHAKDLVMGQIVLRGGEEFPRCVECGNDMYFSLAYSTPEVMNDPSFQSLQVYEIPHLIPKRKAA